MKALITKRSIVIASVSLLLALIALISVNVFTSSGPVTGFANSITRPVRELASTVARAFGTIYASIYRYEELEKRLEELLRTNAQLQQNYRESEALAEENDRLRAALDFRDLHAGYTSEMATLMSWGADNWSSSFIINKGYMNSNIERGHGVVTEYGVLLGQVSEVGATTSTVITVLDTTFRAAVYVGGDGTDNVDGTATAKGDFTFMRSELLILDHIDDDVVIIPGSSVVTSGAGAVFPPNLIIGEVVAVDNHPSGIGRYATVRPQRDINTINNVFVIISFDSPD